jgi:hypothetical protein
VYALYRRRWRLLVACLVWTAVNPVLFPPPDSDEAWMTRAVRAERWWIRTEDNSTLGLTPPNVYNAGSAVAAVYALSAAWRRRPVRTVVATGLMVGLKLYWLVCLVERYDSRGD